MSTEKCQTEEVENNIEMPMKRFKKRLLSQAPIPSFGDFLTHATPDESATFGRARKRRAASEQFNHIDR